MQVNETETKNTALMAAVKPPNFVPEDIYQANMKEPQAGQSVLIITADEVEDLEFFYPYYRFVEAGFHVDVATPGGGAFKGKQSLGLKHTLKIEDVDTKVYDLLYIPGGKAPEKLMKYDEACDVVKDFAEAGKPIAAVCHGAQLLAAANVIKDRKITGWPKIKDQIEKSGATFVNVETIIDGPFITARWPGDLPSHLKFVLQVLYASRLKNARTEAA